MVNGPGFVIASAVGTVHGHHHTAQDRLVLEALVQVVVEAQAEGITDPEEIKRRKMAALRRLGVGTA
jgi:hypothetical protein